MTRIRTTGISTKAFSIKPQRLPISYRVAGSGFVLAVLLFQWLLTASCLRRVGVGDVRQDHELKGYELDNVRFEPLDSNSVPLPIQSALAYWLKRGEKVAVRLDTFEVHWERVGSMCKFLDNTSGGDCQICDYCNPPPSYEGPPCFNVSILGGGWFNIVADSGFIETDNPKLIVEMTPGRTLGACNSPPEPVPFFEPEASGLFRTAPKPPLMPIINGDTDGKIKLHVVETGAGLAQKTAYQLARQTIDGANYWTWTIEGSPLWLENFSPNLRATYIRIFRGRCADGSAQGKQCAVPDEAVLVRPSRILFLQDFPDWGTVTGHPGESSHRCYSNPNAGDGNFIKLDICRERYDLPINQTIQKDATPAYEFIQADKKLTWLVEFNTSEGADADLTTPAPDPMPSDAVLIIEFTVQADS
jgi:hypothetical protein